MDIVTDAAAEARLEIELDPFAFHIGSASKVSGLRDGYPSSDPNYVFHTDYVDVGRGIATFTARFAGLKSHGGSLQLRVHMMGQGDPPPMALVNSERIAFNRLIEKEDGIVAVKFEAFPNARYAFYGAVIGQTEAEAEGLIVTLHLPEPEGSGHDGGVEARNSETGAQTEAHAHILSLERPRLAVPVSQIATADQLDEKVAKQAAARVVGGAEMTALERWAAIYTLQALRAYGVLSTEARGLGVGAIGEALAMTVAGEVGALTVIVDRDAAFDPALLSAADRTGKIRYGVAPQTFGGDLVNYDFLWASDIGSIESASSWIRDIELVLTSLLPGGFAVLTFSYDPADALPGNPLGAYPRRVGRTEVERLALILISRGHQVAQLKLVGDYKPLTIGSSHHSAIGLVVRRAMIAS